MKQITTNEVACLIIKKLTDRFVDRDVEEIVINRPGEVVLKERRGGWIFEDAPELDEAYLWRVCKVLANVSGVQFDAAVKPIVSTKLPDMPYRFQGIMGQNVLYGSDDLSGVAIAIRSLNAPDNIDYSGYGLSEDASTESFLPASAAKDLDPMTLQRIRETIRNGGSLLVSGETSTGKTTLLNKLLTEIPHDERIITVEDTREVHIPHKNRVHLLVPRNEGSNKVGYAEVIDALMRMTPNWIVAGELSMHSAQPIYNILGKGHPIASTVHAGNAYEALEAFTKNISLSSGGDVSGVVDDLARQIGVVIQLMSDKGERRVKEVVFPSTDPEFREKLASR
jgi:type IV secretory pathway ATPase VirB11/archaellum biosynthesis ATPase